VEGVTVVDASPTEHTVTVEFDDAHVTLDQVKKALNDAGYVVGEEKALPK